DGSLDHGYDTDPKSVRCVACSVPPAIGLLAAWSRAGGTYADATNQAGRYNVSNGIVIDTLTGIQWQQTASSIAMNWTDAATYCANQTTGGLSGWRLPNIMELGTLMDYTSSTTPYLNGTVFPGTPASSFWSSTPEIGNGGGNSWDFQLGNYGKLEWDTTATTNMIRCVRSCYSLPTSSRYTVGTGTSAGTVADYVTNLIWQKVAPTTGGPNSNGLYPPSSAKTYCSSLNLGGFSSGWRLPTIRELQTLVDYSNNYATLMMDTTVFSGEQPNRFWSSTPLAGNPSSAWIVHFNYGDVYANDVSNAYSVRCVR
ncbi:MAG: DUF1566 domain-containing protein, partial [Myxococcaceae bacterium]